MDTRFSVRRLDIGHLHLSIVCNAAIAGFRRQRLIGFHLDTCDGAWFTTIRAGVWFLNADWTKQS